MSIPSKLTPSSKNTKSRETSNEESNNCSTIPWVKLATPCNTQHKHNQAAAVENQAEIIESLQLASHRLALVEETVVRWVIEEIEEDNGKSTCDEIKPVTPPPAQSSSVNEATCH